jgi:glycosyltransferase involved in cell wall biosynthesis
MNEYGDVGSGRHVAIIMRTKDRPILLARALASVLCQKHQDWHLYVVNDGGARDEVERLMRDYQTGFNGRLSVIHHDQSLGMEAASNVALKQSHGDFVVVHDDDDSWSPEFLEKSIIFLNSEAGRKCAAVVSDVVLVHERIKGDAVVEESRLPWGRPNTPVAFGDLMRENDIPPISLLIRRRVVDLIGAFNADLPVLGDWDYNIRIMMIGDIGKIHLPLAYYHHRPYSAETNIYGNTLGPGQTRHDLYRTYYANSMLRNLAQKDPAYLAIIHVLLHRMEENQKEIRRMLGKPTNAQVQPGFGWKKQRKTIGQRISRESNRVWGQMCKMLGH